MLSVTLRRLVCEFGLRPLPPYRLGLKSIRWHLSMYVLMARTLDAMRPTGSLRSVMASFYCECSPPRIIASLAPNGCADFATGGPGITQAWYVNPSNDIRVGLQGTLCHNTRTIGVPQLPWTWTYGHAIVHRLNPFTVTTPARPEPFKLQARIDTAKSAMAVGYVLLYPYVIRSGL